MKNTIQLLKKAPWHLFLFSIYPIMELWLLNIEQVSSKVIFRPLFFALLGTLLLWSLATYLFKDSKRAALLTTILSIAFFTYGHVYLLLKGVQLFSTLTFRHRTLFIIWVIIGALAFFMIKNSKKVEVINLTLNWISIILMSIFVIELSNFQLIQIQSTLQSDPLSYSSKAPGASSSLPDVMMQIGRAHV